MLSDEVLMDAFGREPRMQFLGDDLPKRLTVTAAPLAVLVARRSRTDAVLFLVLVARTRLRLGPV